MLLDWETTFRKFERHLLSENESNYFYIEFHTSSIRHGGLDYFIEITLKRYTPSHNNMDAKGDYQVFVAMASKRSSTTRNLKQVIYDNFKHDKLRIAMPDGKWGVFFGFDAPEDAFDFLFYAKEFIEENISKLISEYHSRLEVVSS